MNRQGQGESIQLRYMKYRHQDEFDKIDHRCGIVIIEDDVPHAGTFSLYLILLYNIETSLMDGFKAVWILSL